MSLAELPRRRFSAEEVLRMVETGVLGEDEPVELLDGELVVMSPQGPPHRTLTVVIRRALEDAFGDAFHVQDHSPIDAGPHSLPEPDVAVVRGDPRDFLARHPSGAEVPLVVEVSITSQAADRAKARIYAAAGVPEYWWLDVPARRLHVFTNPRADGEYGTVTVLRETDDARPAGCARSLRVADLLP